MFNDDMWDLIVAETNRYHYQQVVAEPNNTNDSGLQSPRMKCKHDDFNMDKVCNSANPTKWGLYICLSIVTWQCMTYFTSHSSGSLRWKPCSKTCFDAVGESRIN